MKYVLMFMILIFACALNISAQQKCFQNNALKGLQIVRFTQTGGKIAGTFEYENGESELAPVYQFTGTWAGNVMKIKFADGKMPDVAPSEMRDFNWQIVRQSGTEILRIKFYGKNYETGKYADYVADFTQCGPNYDELSASAKPVHFAKGKSSATVALAFQNSFERKVFSLKARRNQTVSIDAAGCKIQIYLPDGGLYESIEWTSADGSEKTTTTAVIDRITIKSATRTGDYLIVLQKMAENAAPKTATFKVTN